MKTSMTAAFVVGAGALLGARPATAQPVNETTAPAPQTATADTYNWSDPDLESKIGVDVAIGGGVTGFTDKTMRNSTSSVGGLWDARVSIGTHVPIGFDVSYVGTANTVHQAGEAMNLGDLIGTTIEADARFNVLPQYPMTPYLFAGFGWTRYQIRNLKAAFAPAGMRSVDDIGEVPMGAGLAYRMNGLTVDLRGTFRATQDQTLIPKDASVDASSTVSSNFAPMHSWEASAAVGYEF